MTVKRARWQDSDDKLLKQLVDDGHSIDDIAARMGRLFETEVTPSAITSRWCRLFPGVSLANAIEEVRRRRSDRQDTLTATPPTKSGAALPDPIERLVAITEEGLEFEDVCNILNLSPKKARDLIEQANAAGYRVEVAGDRVGLRPHTEAASETLIEVAQPGDLRSFAAVGDIHMGSKYHKREYFLDFMHTAYAQGVRLFCHGGDGLDGVYRHSQWEQTHHGFEEQCQEFVASMPFWPDAQHYYILGNHDETHGRDNGMEVGIALQRAFEGAGRKDFHYLGARGAYMRLRGPGEHRGLLVEMWHPCGSANTYAASYPLQKKIEKYHPGQKPDVLLAFHWHKQMYIETRGVHAFACGCWQGGQSSFGKSLGGAPSIGSWIIQYALTQEGAVRRIIPEWKGYQEKEVIRNVELG